MKKTLNSLVDEMRLNDLNDLKFCPRDNIFIEGAKKFIAKFSELTIVVLIASFIYNSKEAGRLKPPSLKHVFDVKDTTTISTIIISGLHGAVKMAEVAMQNQGTDKFLKRIESQKKASRESSTTFTR
ncbi:hypothetical protein [Methylomagnum ishizawai]|nr:hypothetical protein [Methylomagnum ishizawai]